MRSISTAYLQQLIGATLAAGLGDQHRAHYQNRQNPYSWKLFGELSEEDLLLEDLPLLVDKDLLEDEEDVLDLLPLGGKNFLTPEARVLRRLLLLLLLLRLPRAAGLPHPVEDLPHPERS